VQFVRPILLTVLVALLAGCGLIGGTPSPTTCDGIAAEFGACDEDRPVFNGQTCSEVGAEFGEQLSPRAIDIFDGPQTVDGNDRTVLLTRLVVLHIQLANKHLRDSGQAVDCDVPEFVEAAEAELSSEFKARVGDNVFFGQTVSYEEWRADLERFLVVIDRDENEPYAPLEESLDAGS
jgi:hypothetical protein